MIRLTELVTKLVDAGYKLGDPNPRVVVRWYTDDGELLEREIEMVWAGDRDEIVLHVPREAQLAGEPGAGVVVDESPVELVDIDLLLAFATGERGCACAEGRCMLPEREDAITRHPECRERLKRQMLERQRAGR